MEYSQYISEFLVIALAHLFAVASPGPDFAIVMKHSINFGKRVAIITSAGIAVAIFVHVAYALAGIGLVINSTPWLYKLLIIFASIFLLYLGYGAIKSKPHDEYETRSNNIEGQISSKKAFLLGFVTNGLNPKATIFFLSLFTVSVSSSTPLLIKGVYGLYLAIATFIWFLFLSLILTKPAIRQSFALKGYMFERGMGVIFILLALNILYSEIL